MPLQVPQLDDRNFQQIVDEVVARIPAHTPEWNNFNQSDPGITLVQLFAYMMENLLYRSNRIPEANRLKFLTLLRIPLRPASPAYGLAVFQNDRGPIQAIPLDKGVELYAGKVPFRTRTDVNILPVSAAVFSKAKTAKPADADRYQELYDVSPDQAAYYKTTTLEPLPGSTDLPVVDLRSNGTTIDSAIWVALVAPKNVDRSLVRQALDTEVLTLGIYPAVDLTPDTKEPTPLEPEALEAKPVNQSQLVFEIAAPSDPSDTDTAKYTLLNVEYAENVLELPGIVQLRLPPASQIQLWNFDPNEEGKGEFPPLVEDRELADRIITWIRIRYPEAVNTTHSARISWVGVNAARIVQALRVERERLGVGTGTPNQVFKVANTPVIVEHPLNIESPAPGTVSFQLELMDEAGNIEQWIQVDDLYTAELRDKVYQLDPESGQIQCGDGLRGMRFPLGSVIRATYEYGGGPQGNIATGTLNKAPALPGGIKVNNPVQTWGASPGQTVEDGERSISRYLRHRDRLVTVEDFREIALQTPNAEIGRVEVIPLFDPDIDAELFDPNNPDSDKIPGTVTVMIVPWHPLDQVTEPNPDRLLLDAVRVWLEPRRLITCRVFVRGPQFVKLFVASAIELVPGHVSAIVNRNVKTALRTYLSPLVGGIPPEGQKTGTGFPCDSELRVKDLEAVVARVEGVRYVVELRAGYIIPAADGGVGPIVELQQAGLQLHGLQLPWHVNVDVREGGSALAPSEFGESTGQPGGGVAVPVMPVKKC